MQSAPLGRLCVITCLFLVSSAALADSESLSFRLNAQGEVEAVISGIAHGCGTFVEPPMSSVVSNASIVLVSIACTPAGYDPLPYPYQTVANLGHLSMTTTYSFVWSLQRQLDRLSWTATLLPLSLLAVPVPALSPMNVSKLILIIALCAIRLTTRSTGPAGTGLLLGDRLWRRAG
jgi:hypothetical protein